MSGAALSPDLWLKQATDAGHTYFYNPSTQVRPKKGDGMEGQTERVVCPWGESC